MVYHVRACVRLDGPTKVVESHAALGSFNCQVIVSLVLCNEWVIIDYALVCTDYFPNVVGPYSFVR